jgi:hypothetical protein
MPQPEVVLGRAAPRLASAFRTSPVLSVVFLIDFLARSPLNFGGGPGNPQAAITGAS